MSAQRYVDSEVPPSVAPVIVESVDATALKIAAVPDTTGWVEGRSVFASAIQRDGMSADRQLKRVTCSVMGGFHLIDAFESAGTLGRHP